MTTLFDIRRMIAHRASDIRELMLTPQQVEVLTFIRRWRKPTRSRDISRRFDMSAQHACMVLDAIYRKGYLQRTSEPQDSGGYEYEYVWTLD
jgi:DNA-binding MarR family transcriptional regulator